MKNFMPLAVLLAAVFLLPACECDEDQKDLADLVVTTSEFAEDVSQKEFQVGDLTQLAVRILNLLSGDCTKDADANEHAVALYRRSTSGGSDELIGHAYYSVPRLAPDQGFDDHPNVKFEAPGEYYVQDVVDSDNVVPERDENNNANETTGVACAHCKTSNPVRTIQVKSTPEFEARVQRGERIPYVTFLPSPNLLRVELKYYQ